MLDALPPDQQASVFTHCERISLVQGARWLMDEFTIKIDDDTLGDWLRARRATQSDLAPARKAPPARLSVLSDDLQDAIFQLCNPVPLHAGVPLLKEKLDIHIGMTALGNWLRKRRIGIAASDRLDKIREASECATLIRKAFGPASEITDANIAHFAQAVFEEFSKPGADRDDKRLVPYMALTLKARDQELKAHGIALAVEKFKASLRTKLEIALHALGREIQGNQSAQVKYLELKDQLASNTAKPS